MLKSYIMQKQQTTNEYVYYNSTLKTNTQKKG